MRSFFQEKCVSNNPIRSVSNNWLFFYKTGCNSGALISEPEKIIARWQQLDIEYSVVNPF